MQILPFIYSSLYIAALVAYNYVPEDAQLAMDSILYVSPICIIAFLVLSKTLRMCRWHRITCSIPAIPLVVNFFDYYVISFSETFVYSFNYVIALMCVLLLIAAYKVFVK